MQLREQGIIKMWIPSRGFGFLERAGSADVFFHVSDLHSGAAEILRTGMHAEFEVRLDVRTGRPKAVGVKLQSEDGSGTVVT